MNFVLSISHFLSHLIQIIYNSFFKFSVEKQFCSNWCLSISENNRKMETTDIYYEKAKCIYKLWKKENQIEIRNVSMKCNFDIKIFHSKLLSLVEMSHSSPRNLSPLHSSTALGLAFSLLLKITCCLNTR